MPTHPPSGLLCGRLSYLDTLTVYFETVPELAQVQALAATCGGQVLVHPSLPYQILTWPGGLSFQQPTLRTLEALIVLPGAKLITRVDVALDLLTSWRAEADDLKAFISAHLVQRWRGKSTLKEFRGTLYTADAKAANKLVIYSDRPSKVIGAPCCHLEWRIISARACRAAALDDLQSLRSLNFPQFWAERLRLARLPTSGTELEALGKKFHKQPKRKKPWFQQWGPIQMEMFHRTGGYLVRREGTAENLIRSQGASFRRHTYAVSTDWLMPENCGHLC